MGPLPKQAIVTTNGLGYTITASPANMIQDPYGVWTHDEHLVRSYDVTLSVLFTLFNVEMAKQQQCIISNKTTIKHSTLIHVYFCIICPPVLVTTWYDLVYSASLLALASTVCLPWMPHSCTMLITLWKREQKNLHTLPAVIRQYQKAFKIFEEGRVAAATFHRCTKPADPVTQ